MSYTTDMAIFARVVAEGSLSAAGRQLNLSPACVSKRVRHLEEHLGVRLLTRDSRNLSLTEEGRVYIDWCTRILADIAEAEAVTAQRRTVPKGSLVVTSTLGFGRRYLAPLVAEFVAKYPDITVRLTLSDGILDLREHEIDVAIRIGASPDPSLIVRKIADDRRVVCASPSYLESFGEPRSPDDLARHECLVLDRPSGPQNHWEFNTPEGPRVIKVAGRMMANTGETIHDWALAGLGLAWKSTWDIGPDLDAGLLRPLLLDYVARPTNIYAAYAERRLLPAKIRLFVDHVANRFGHEPFWDRFILQRAV